MAQARRKSRAAPRATSRATTKGRKPGGNLAGIVMLLVGIVIGCLATILWQGAKTDDGGVGAGIRRMVENIRQPPTAGEENKPGQRQTAPQKPAITYQFFEVLPALEVAVPTADEAAPKQTKQAAAESSDATGDDSYVLQAGSYRRRADADRLKANLALNGLASTIQKVSIEGRGDFYRVRLGPYSTYEEMVEADQQLSKTGIEGLRLKVYKAG